MGTRLKGTGMSRKVIYGVGISLDGFIARPNGDVDFLKADPAYDFGAFFKTMDVVLMGRKTHDFARKHGMSAYPRMKNYVFSRNKRPGLRDGVEYTRESPAKIVRELKKQKGKHIYLCGGSSLAQALFRAGLVDELSLGVIPVLIAKGIPAFLGPFPQTQLKLTECQTFKNGMLILTYKVLPPRKKKSRNPKAAR